MTFVSVKWIQDGFDMEQTCPTAVIAAELRAHLASKGYALKAVAPKLGDRVEFWQGILRRGRITRLGRTRVWVTFRYVAGHESVAKIPFAKLDKAVGDGWVAALWWNQ
jgi:hypothetical protein